MYNFIIVAIATIILAAITTTITMKIRKTNRIFAAATAYVDPLEKEFQTFDWEAWREKDQADFEAEIAAKKAAEKAEEDRINAIWEAWAEKNGTPFNF